MLLPPISCPQFILFLPCAVAYYQLTNTQASNFPTNVHVFQFLYFFSSFWGQVGASASAPRLMLRCTVPTACPGQRLQPGQTARNRIPNKTKHN